MFNMFVIYGIIFLAIFVQTKKTDAILNIVNIELKEEDFKETGPIGVNVVTISVTISTSTPSDLQVTWMKDIETGSIPIYIGDPEFITWQNERSLSKELTELDYFIEYLYGNYSEDDDLKLPDFKNALQHIGLLINVGSNTIVKLQKLNKVTPGVQKKDQLTLHEIPMEAYVSMTYNEVFTTKIQLDIDEEFFIKGGSNGAWFHQAQDPISFNKFQLPEPNANEIQNNDSMITLHSTSQSHNGKISIGSSITAVRNQTELLFKGVYTFEMISSDMLIRSTVVVKNFQIQTREEIAKIRAFYSCAANDLMTSNSYGKFSIGFPNERTVESSCLHFLCSNLVRSGVSTYSFRRRTYSYHAAVNPLLTYRMPSGLFDSDLVYLFADGQFDQGEYELRAESTYGYTETGFSLTNYTTATVNITTFQMTRTHTHIECILTGDPQPDRVKLYTEGPIEANCYVKYANCDYAYEDAVHIKWKLPLRKQQLRGVTFTCEARARHQGTIKDQITVH